MMEPPKRRSLLKKIGNYCKNTHVHGLKYLESPERHFITRLAWGILLVICWALMAFTFQALIATYRSSAINFVTDTSYLDFNTSFPAVSVCQINGLDWSLIDEPFDVRDNRATLEFFLSDLLFFSGSCYSCQAECFSCSSLNISQIVQRMRKPCKSLLGRCTWNKREFGCCEHFLPLETEFGVCFVLNSLHSPHSTLQLEVNRKTDSRTLSIETLEDVRVYFHGREEVPCINSESTHMQDISLGESYEILFTVVEIDNERSIASLPVDQRKCRFPWEVPEDLKVHKLYSYSSCLVQCHAENHLKMCNCTHHFMPYYSRVGYCDIEGLKCLTNKLDIVNRLHAKGSDKPGLDCDCYPSCTEPEFNIVSNQRIFNQTLNGLTIGMHSLPTSKFKRVIAKSPLDLIVSIGGAAGFFIGASLQSIIEGVFLLTTDP